MKIIDCEIDMMLNWANDPSMTVIVEGTESNALDGIPWKWHPNGMVTRELDGLVEFKYIGAETDGDDRMKGYGGAKFQFPLEDGTVLESTNVWSSRAESAGETLGEPLKDVSVRAIDSKYNVAMSGFGLKKDVFDRLMSERGLTYEMDGEYTMSIVKVREEV